jgi:sec-independent protein translocase protein TatA
MSLGPAEILVVLVIALVIFGPKRLPEVGRQVGGALRELRKVQDSVQSELRGVLDDTSGRGPGTFSADPPGYDAPTDEPQSGEAKSGEPTPHALPPAEPDLGDETNDIDGLSGGTFS